MEETYWLPAEQITAVTEYNGEPCDTTLEDLVSNSGGLLYFEYQGSETLYPNVCSAASFSINAQPANLIGGIHSPQRPK